MSYKQKDAAMDVIISLSDLGERLGSFDPDQATDELRFYVRLAKDVIRDYDENGEKDQ